ncbi:hypothetical protein CNYM01_08057 [Colletotrichum nymphaeae SA-01]|uniref:Thioesterase domain-containing protein n=1 Tax=Colletotrichum nymphaeae SA-01 TaxID=1460502 RepID=A0A135SQ45_9PEZI|nr:hypothetical protein CNYM01_08057 [Colletotrichum nymphaeae SA-01]
MEPLNPAKRGEQEPTLIELIRNAAESTSHSIIAYKDESIDATATFAWQSFCFRPGGSDANISRHRVSRTFAPHSFLAKLSSEVMLEQTSSLDEDLDLGCLQWLGSGGEANTVDVCEALQTQLEKYGVRKDIIVPGFGMTETCAGCIYNTNCPTYDREQNSQHVTVGKGISGLQLRVRLSDGNSPSTFANAGQVGLLELSGDVVFDGYFNDRGSTATAFTDDGWFITGDLACVNHDGQLILQVDVIGLHTSSSAIVLPLNVVDLKPSALGKLPRGAIKSAFEKGKYAQHLRKASEAYRIDNNVAEETASPLRHLFATKYRTLVIEGSEGKDGVGSPVVTLRPEGRKMPLWLVHPGVGEIHVLMNLVRLIDDRPVYAFRAEGLDSSVSPFDSLDELLDYYLKHLKAVQGEGPYAIAGYSFGSMIAFELCKRLEAGGDEVLYCGCWNLPPHIKHRMRQLGWVECLANLFHFTKLMGQDQAIHQISILRRLSKQEAVAHLRALSDSDRWLELGLGEAEFAKWADLASSLQHLARDYEPRGTIRSMDIFVADPLKEVAVDREDWVQNKLSRWREFVSDVQFYDVPGEHYSMLDKINVLRFADKLKDVLEAREGPLRRGL